MDLKQYRNKLIGSEDERAVSPVIGVILMVAITVILAAVIAAFVLDIGDLDDSAPNAQFDWSEVDGEEDQYEVTLTSGDDINFDDLSVDGVDEDAEDADDGDVDPEDVDSDDWTAGTTLTFDYDDDDDEIQIIWEGDGSSTVLTSHEP